MKKIFSILGSMTIIALTITSFTSAYTQEQQEAYQWARSNGITTQPTIEEAKMNSPLTRQAFAKMVVNYLENVVGVKQATSNSCYFPDEDKITSDLLPYTKKACTYGIMGSDGKNFSPTETVDRAQLGTVFSRILWGNRHNVEGKGYYIYHVNALQDAGIMNNISNVLGTPAKRGDVMIMFKRLYENFGPYVHMNGISISPYGNTIKSVNEYMDEYMIEDGEHIVYYDSGEIAVKMNYKNGQKDGEWVAYYENGQLQKKNFYKNGEMDGEQLEYYENGQLKSKGFYKNGKEDGEFIDYYENGQLEGKGFYKDGEEDGEFIAYYGNGQLKGKLAYKNGKEDGEYISYYENGQLEIKGNFKNGKPNGSWVYYYENGQLGTKLNYKDGLENGEVIDYHENGKIKDKGYYKNGNPNGEWVTYYENGQLQTKANFKNGELDGEIIAYYESGKLKAKGNYKNGKEDGEYISYYENGQLESKGIYKDDKANGEFIAYYENGQLRAKMNYKSGKLDGAQNGYYEDGSIRFSHKFKNGFGIKSYFDEKGNLIGTGTEIFTDEMEEDGGTYKSIVNGLEIKYHENGQTREISYYKEGELDGTQVSYYENGQIKSICNYDNGIISGDCTMYDEDGEEITQYSNNYGPTILPDRAEIIVEKNIVAGKATNLKITMMKDGAVMTGYTGTIIMMVTDENGYLLNSSEYSLPNRGVYTFLPGDLGSKEFQKGLEIKKEGNFYIEVEDLNDETTLGKQLVTVRYSGDVDEDPLVSYSPNISNIKTKIDADNDTVYLTRDVDDDSLISGYLITYWIDGGLSGSEWTYSKELTFTDVPYDTTVNVTVTPYGNNGIGAASETIQFTINS